MQSFGSGVNGSMNNIIKYCNNKQCISGNNTPYLKKATAGNDPTITKAMRCAWNVKNTKRHNCNIVVVGQNNASANYNTDIINIRICEDPI